MLTPRKPISLPDLSNPSTASVPSGRWSRLVRLGGMATGVAGGMLAEGMRQIAQGNRPRVSDLLLTPANARRVTQQLVQLRGAAMKVGQLISMDSGDLLPPALADILARLRSDAQAMPKKQVLAVLNASWGAGWDRHFTEFSWTPVAAASIGQVHRAQRKDGRVVAVKIQYPGVRTSIDSDVDNVVGLLRMSGLLPRELDIQGLMDQAKRQLHEEADYLREGSYLKRYGELLADASDFVVPELHSDLTTQSVLTMSFVGGVPVESVVELAQTERDHVLGLLMGLLFRELFEFQLIQTDPNFANYRYDTSTRQLILLDFGATRPYQTRMVQGYRQLMAGAATSDQGLMHQAALGLGYFDAQTTEKHRLAVLQLFDLALEPLRHRGDYDFGSSDMATRLREAGMALGMERDCWHIPPIDALLLHRKLGGLYLLAARLKARVNVYELTQPFL